MNSSKKFLLRGLPTTVLINKNGEEFGRIIGAVNFDDEEIIKWLKNYSFYFCPYSFIGFSR